MRRLFNRWRAPLAASTPTWNLETPLLHWDEYGDGGDPGGGRGGLPYTIRDSFANCFVAGSTGSGKSSTSIRLLCERMIAAGYGMVFFTVKRDDAATYAEYVRAAGREQDLVVYSPTNPLRYNVIAGEMAQSSDPLGLVENLTALLMSVARIGDSSGRGGSRGGGGGGGENAEYFRQAAERLCHFALLMLVFSGEPVTITNLYRLIIAAPKSRVEGRSAEWQATSFFWTCAQCVGTKSLTASQRADFDLALLFFMEEFSDLNARTRTTVESTLTATTGVLSRGAARDSLSALPEECNFDPAMIERDKILILDYPILVHRDVGRLLQLVVQYALIRCLSRRDVAASPRPVALVQDECQHLMSEHLALFATTSRSSRTALVCATQSVSTLLEAFGGKESEPRMHALLGNMQLQIHHQQTDTSTIQYLQELTGRARHTFMSGNSGPPSDWLDTVLGGTSGQSSGFSEHMEFDLQAGDFNGLAKGGPPKFISEAIVYQGGRPMADGRSWIRVRFGQCPGGR